MTAAELIAQLKALPPETPVLVEGYETGFDEIVDLRAVEVSRLAQPEDWEGEFDKLAQLPCCNQGAKGGLRGLLSQIKPDTRFTEEESRDSAIYDEVECEASESSSTPETGVLQAAVIRGRRGHRR
ncbi:hypothetical protein [Marinobacter salarius]|uniref:hypothetical protein n=1 Tax=Marinobacter salarius TaxID=1420917 RepID=UPI0025A34375|nr:hypothetical protein [Marinobacter salarius]MDM8181347.1 hypothetical protein [Marinobacter salarius]